MNKMERRRMSSERVSKRCKKVSWMHAPKDMGGLGVPDFRMYYVAAQLA